MPALRLKKFIYTALVVIQAGILVTGGLVRITASGLGCPTWPQCTGTSIAPVKGQIQGPVHAWIEFGNRLLTVLLFVAIIAAIIGVIRWRSDYPNNSERLAIFRLAFIQFLGIVAQIIVGGISVLTHLNPLVVGLHFLISIFLIASTLSLRQRVLKKERVSVEGNELLLTRLLLLLTFTIIVIGTLVTGSGPYAGDIQAPRYHFDSQKVALLHADLVIALVALTFSLILMSKANKPRIHLFFALILSQGLIGYLQYFTHRPEYLVIAHLIGQDLVWLSIWDIAFSGNVLSTTKKKSGVSQ